MFSIEEFPLRFESNAMEPFMSAKTFEFHHGKHLAAYINNLNGLIAGTKYANMPLEQIIIDSVDIPAEKKIFNNAAQTWNHNFFFGSMARDKKSAVPEVILDTFGGIEKFKADFSAAAAGLFGSGWAWLVIDATGKIAIETTANADTPIAHGKRALLGLDVWEHAYYLDYQNRRVDFISAFLDHLVDWTIVEERIKA